MTYLSLRDKLAREIGFSGRDRNDMCETADEFWHHSGEELRGKFYRQADAILELLKGAVKPLEFYWPYQRSSGYMVAETAFPNLIYETGLRGDGKAYYCKVRAKHSIYGLSDMFQSKDAAQKAAQADYSRRILAALGVK